MQLPSDEYPRLLVVSANPISTSSSNGKTLLSMLDGWPGDKIAQIYSQGTTPEGVLCKNYYRVTDMEMVNRFLHRSEKTATVYTENSAYEPELKDEDLPQKGLLGKAYKLYHKAMTLRLKCALLARDIYWRDRYWKTPLFTEWCRQFQPQAILVVCGYNSYLFKMALYASSLSNAPITLFATDDYYTPYFLTTPLGWIHQAYLIKWFRQTLASSNTMLTISPSMAASYSRRYNIDCKFVVNSPSRVSSGIKPWNSEKIRMVYAGSLHTNRWKTILQLGYALEAIRKTGVDIRLDIYGPVCDQPQFKKAISEMQAMKYRGKLNAADYEALCEKTNIFVHVEAFDRWSKRKTRLSLSTKIPEYMASGGCIFMLGPGDVSSTAFVEENRVGYVCKSNKIAKIKKSLLELLENEDQYYKYIKNALSFSKKEDRKSMQRKVLMSLQQKSKAV